MSSMGGPNDVLQQVNQFWSMLDDLSQNDPKAYQRLVDKQMKDGIEFTAPPEPGYCLRTEILGPKKGLLYINVCGWRRVPAPQDPSKPIPLFGGKLETDTAGGGEECSVLDVALSPAVLQKTKEDRSEREQVHLLVLSFAQQQHGLRLSQQYTVTSGNLKGSLKDMQHRLSFGQYPNGPAASAIHPYTAAQTPGSLLKQISSLREDEKEGSPTVRLTSEPAEHQKKNLIQVISSTVTAQPQTPEYQLTVNSDPEGISRSVELTVELPKVSSMSECQLSISQDDVLLEVDDLYHLLVKLPEIVNEESASAIFNKKKRRLSLKVAVL